MSTDDMDEAAYVAHMDGLLRKIDAVFAGEVANDAAIVAAVSCTWAIYCCQSSTTKRKTMLESVINTMRTELKNMEDTEGQGRFWMH